MEVLFWDAVIFSQDPFRLIPEVFDAIDVIVSSRIFL